MNATEDVSGIDVTTRFPAEVVGLSLPVGVGVTITVGVIVC